MQNILTIDVEDWRSVVRRKTTGEIAPPSSMVVDETKLILDTLGQHGVRATFFVLANVAQRFPELVRAIDDAGHEVGSHGLSHSRVFHQSPEEFRQETRRAKEVLEATIGKPVHGYRAAEFSITKRSWWALDILADEGFTYDSSIYPIAGKRYGVPDAPLEPHRIQLGQSNTIMEFPLTAVRIWGRRWPFAGGGYFGLFPYLLTQWAIREANRQGRPSVVYLHPYEFSQRKLKIQSTTRTLKSLFLSSIYSAKHNYSRSRVPSRFHQLLHDFTFVPVREVFQDVQTG